MKNIGRIESIEGSKLLSLIWTMGTNVYVIAGLSLFVIGTFFWLVLLSRLDLSFVYPFGALQYFMIYLISYFLLGETISIGKIIGVAIIMSGILVIGRFG
jgi:drug/metabolite transporter (DMT)-like permease